MLGTIAVAALAVGAVFALTQRAEQNGATTQAEPQIHPMEMSAGTVASPRADAAKARATDSQAIAPKVASATVPIEIPTVGQTTTAAAPAAGATTNASTSSTAAATLVPVVAEGRTSLGDSVFVERVGTEITVRFDNGSLRTRQNQKFERIVRTTLPMVYGQAVATALDSVPPGRFLRGGTLLTELPRRGIALNVPTLGVTMMVYPVTRAGRGGPLVVAYRATIAQ